MKKEVKKESKDSQKQPITPTEYAEKLGVVIGFKRLYLKREDLHPYGSHKGRSIPYMIDFYAKEGVKNFAISSSGNAALAAAMHIDKISHSDPLKMNLDVYIGNNANRQKIEKIEAFEGDNIHIMTKERPVQALTMAEQDGVTSLRQSTNDLALVGYTSLAEEIASAIDAENNRSKVSAVFVGTSSGTTAQALAQYFLDNKLNIQVHIVQTTSCHPLTDPFDIKDIPEEISVADAIVDRTARRKDALIPLIKKTGGKGWIITNDEISIAQKVVKENTGLELSTNGVLGIAGAMQASYVGYEISGSVVCIVCGE